MGNNIYASRLSNLLRHYKVPENEYSFDGEKQGNCVFAQKCDNLWYVRESKNGEIITRGMFYSECSAYDFVFYLVMKNHRSLKKTWW